ncbi:MAG TPA: helix-turn-helix domain-containing protein [Streptosporangiaceae bacterium]|nr:helix-turn-helix domain-containing protein [Streptosporangiaceae bacterium]
MSEVLFGQRYRLEVMVAIASSRDGLVCLTDLAKDLQLTPSNLQHPLRDLVRCGLLSRLPPGDSKRRFYQRNESLAWPFVVEMASHAEGLGLVMEHF